MSQRRRTRIDAAEVGEFVQLVLRIRRLPRVTAVTAARWLDSVGILRDSDARRGKPLRELLRQGKVRGQRQESNRRWYIENLAHESEAP